MYTQTKVNSGFVGFLFLVSLCLLLAFHTVPAQKELGALKAKLETASQELLLFKGEIDTLPAAAAAKLSEVEQKTLLQEIPEALNQDELILDLNKMSKASDVAFNSLTFTVQENEKIPSVNISAGFFGTAANIIRFMKMVEVNPRKLVVKDAGISRSENEGGIELMNLNATIQAFYRGKN